MRNKKAFTLIELVSVLVILAILALIVTPLVLNIIRKARTAADKRSIDAYGRSIELAIADYLLENGTFPTSIEQLTIEYSGDRVVCSNSGINSDGTIYLTDCTVNNRAVTGYAYGRYGAVAEYEEYTVGQEVRYNNVDYYVIKASGANESSVVLIKATPITSEEISLYLSSTEVAGKLDTSGTYVKMAYYSAEDCVSAGDKSGCTTDYAVSDVKQVVDVWKTNYASEVSEARLATVEELSALGYEYKENDTAAWYDKTENTPSWLYASNYEYSYWTMSQYTDNVSCVWLVSNDGNLPNFNNQIYNDNNAVRPVIVISKSVLN